MKRKSRTFYVDVLFGSETAVPCTNSLNDVNNTNKQSTSLGRRGREAGKCEQLTMLLALSAQREGMKRRKPAKNNAI